MRLTAVVGVSLGLALAGLEAVPALAQDDCARLWIARNTIYKEYGYCFKTRRAIEYFGNEGCRYEREGDIPFSRAHRRLIAQIRASERELGCSG